MLLFRKRGHETTIHEEEDFGQCHMLRASILQRFDNHRHQQHKKTKMGESAAPVVAPTPPSAHANGTHRPHLPGLCTQSNPTTSGHDGGK